AGQIAVLSRTVLARILRLDRRTGISAKEDLTAPPQTCRKDTMNTRIYWLHALTPLHVGSGQGAGFIDLPIIREKVTHWPLVPGSAVKGVLADCHGATDDGRGKNTEKGKLLRAAFGRSDADKENDNAGSLAFTDARLICLAVRSLFGTFAWVTAPLALQRFKRDLDGAKVTDIPTSHCPISDQKIHLPKDAGSVLKLSDGKVYLEDLDFEAKDCDCAKEWGGQLSRWVFPGNSDWHEDIQRTVRHTTG
ncbi:MAG: type III-B CRISPR module RAMP protein Cmr4, partial [Gammaproteobacteria bacterium]